MLAIVLTHYIGTVFHVGLKTLPLGGVDRESIRPPPEMYEVRVQSSHSTYILITSSAESKQSIPTPASPSRWRIFRVHTLSGFAYLKGNGP